MVRVSLHHVVDRALAATPICRPLERSPREIALAHRCLKNSYSTIDAAKRVARACARYVVPCILENPHSSLAWEEAGMAQIRKRVHKR